MDWPPLTVDELKICGSIHIHRHMMGTTDPHDRLRIRQASMGEHAGRQVFGFVKSLGVSRIFEIGTCAGIGAAYMCAGAEQNHDAVTYVGMEGVPEKAALAEETIKRFCPKTCSIIFGLNFDESFEPALYHAKPLQFVYLDGRHKRQYTLAMWDRVIEEMDEGVVLCDDLWWPAQGNARKVMARNPRVDRIVNFARKDAFIIKPA